MYSPDTVVAVQSFIRRAEGDEIIISRPEDAIFLAVPPEAVEVLDHLSHGKTIGEAANIYQQKYGEILDMDEFLCALEAKGIIQSWPAKGDKAALSLAVPGRQASYHFKNFPGRLAQRIFSPPVLASSLLFVILAVAAIFCSPSLMVGPRDLYFGDHRALSWTILMAFAYLTLFLHECAHLVAAKAVGVNSRISLSHRLWYLVAETDLTGLWSVSRQQRYLPLIAGTLLDMGSAAFLILVLWAREREWVLISSPVVRLLRAMVFIYVARIGWQCFLFIRTDFYYVMATLLACKNLLGDTEVYLRNCLSRMVPVIPVVDQSEIPENELRVIRVYAWFWGAGRIAAFFVLVHLTIPLAVRYARNLTSVFRIGYSANPLGFIDALLLAGYFLIPFTIGFFLWIRSIFRRLNLK